jgi:hypothetical protein
MENTIQQQLKDAADKLSQAVGGECDVRFTIEAVNNTNGEQVQRFTAIFGDILNRQGKWPWTCAFGATIEAALADALVQVETVRATHMDRVKNLASQASELGFALVKKEAA